MTEPLTPARIMQVAMGFWPAKALLSAVELDLFTVLGDRSLTGDALGQELGLHSRATADFLDTLVVLKFLERDGDGPAARYRNSAEATAFLDRRSAHHIAGFLDMSNARIFRFWADLTDALKTGKAQNETKNGGASVFAEIYKVPERLEQFIDAMASISAGNFDAFARSFDFSGYTTLCDVGGATGLLSTLVAAQHPHMRCITTDLPAVTAITTRRLQAAGLVDRITAQSVDFFAEPLPKADVITMGMILHDWNLEKKMHLIRAAYDALPANGAFVVIENIIDDARRENLFGLLMSLNMLVEFGDAFDFTGADFTGWCTEVGFRRVEIRHLAGPASAGIAYK